MSTSDPPGEVGGGGLNIASKRKQRLSSMVHLWVNYQIFFMPHLRDKGRIWLLKHLAGMYLMTEISLFLKSIFHQQMTPATFWRIIHIFSHLKRQLAGGKMKTPSQVWIWSKPAFGSNTHLRILYYQFKIYL